MKKPREKDVLTYKDLFGRRVRIVSALDPGLRGLEGVFWDETLNTIVLKTPRGLKRVIKKDTMFKVLPEGTLVHDIMIKGRPHERLKKKYAR